MKVVAFNGSPRKDGNTNLMLRRALELSAGLRRAAISGNRLAARQLLRRREELEFG